MKSKQIQLYLELIDAYLNNRNVYDYNIKNISINSNYVIIRIVEYTGTGNINSEYDIRVEINSNKTVSFYNIDGFNCLYDFLEEYNMTPKEADNEAMEYKTIITKY